VNKRVPWFFSRKAILLLWLPSLLVTIGHYSTPASITWLHDIFRRLYYIPIILGAFAFGLKGSFSISIFASLVYLPHAFTHFFHHDSGQTIEKFLELLLYNIIAYIVGMLADREHQERLKQEAISAKLQESLDEVKLMEEQLIRSGRLQSLGELTAGLAHELKNPLASLLGATDIIADEIPETSERRPMVEILKKELTRLAELLDNFLRFARPGTLQKSEFDVCEMLKEVVDLLSAQASKQQVEVIYNCDLTHLNLQGDREKLKQLAVNLILNAVQAMTEAGKVEVGIRPKTKGKQEFIELVFSDNGPGIPKEIIEKIFNPFVTGKPQGTGLGLSIASRIVDQHQGYIEVENRETGGAQFRVGIAKK